MTKDEAQPASVEDKLNQSRNTETPPQEAKTTRPTHPRNTYLVKEGDQSLEGAMADVVMPVIIQLLIRGVSDDYLQHIRLYMADFLRRQGSSTLEDFLRENLDPAMRILVFGE